MEISFATFFSNDSEKLNELKSAVVDLKNSVKSADVMGSMVKQRYEHASDPFTHLQKLQASEEYQNGKTCGGVELCLTSGKQEQLCMDMFIKLQDTSLLQPFFTEAFQSDDDVNLNHRQANLTKKIKRIFNPPPHCLLFNFKVIPQPCILVFINIFLKI